MLTLFRREMSFKFGQYLSAMETARQILSRHSSHSEVSRNLLEQFAPFAEQSFSTSQAHSQSLSSTAQTSSGSSAASGPSLSLLTAASMELQDKGSDSRIKVLAGAEQMFSLMDQPSSRQYTTQ